MVKDWMVGSEGKNLKFKRETLLNYGMNRWGLNKAHSVGPTSELVRRCSPKSFEQWEEFYFANAIQKKRGGLKITRDYIYDLGRKLYIKLSEVVHSELQSVQEQECIDYAYNLVLNRTYEGYQTEINTVYGQLESILGVKIEPAPDEWDRVYNVDFFIRIQNRFIGLQVKSVSGRALDYYQWERMHQANHERFKERFGGGVFFIYSRKGNGKAKIDNVEVIQRIQDEIEKLQRQGVEKILSVAGRGKTVKIVTFLENTTTSKTSLNFDWTACDKDNNLVRYSYPKNRVLGGARRIFNI